MEGTFSSSYLESAERFSEITEEDNSTLLKWYPALGQSQQSKHPLKYTGNTEDGQRAHVHWEIVGQKAEQGNPAGLREWLRQASAVSGYPSQWLASGESPGWRLRRSSQLTMWVWESWQSPRIFSRLWPCPCPQWSWSFHFVLLSLRLAWKSSVGRSCAASSFSFLAPSVLTAVREAFNQCLLSKWIKRCQKQLHLVVPSLTLLWYSLITSPLLLIILNCDSNEGRRSFITSAKSPALFYQQRGLFAMY